MLIIPAEMVFALAGIVRDDTTLVTVASSMATAGSGSLLLAARPINGSG